MGRMRVAGTALALAGALLVAAPAAHGKFRIALRLGDATPAAGQRVAVTLRTGLRPQDAAGLELRLLAVPPGVPVAAALADEGRFAVTVGRRGSAWSGVVRFPSPGRWRLVVPNWGAPGYAIPPPVVRAVLVSG